MKKLNIEEAYAAYLRSRRRHVALRGTAAPFRNFEPYWNRQLDAAKKALLKYWSES